MVMTPIGTGDDYGEALASSPTARSSWQARARTARTTTLRSLGTSPRLARHELQGKRQGDHCLGASGNDVAYGIAVEPDGKIVAGGYAGIGRKFDFALARFDTSGSLDTSFNGRAR